MHRLSTPSLSVRARTGNLAGLPAQDVDDILRATAVNEVWGVGRKISAKLKAEGVEHVLQLAAADPATVRRRWGATLERTVRELQGQPCIELDDAPGPKKQIACTRSFGHPIQDLSSLVEAVSEFATRAAEKLRAQRSMVTEMLVFVHTSPYRPGPQLSRCVVVPLRRPTDDTVALTRAAADGMKFMYVPGYRFIKAGVILTELQSVDVQQGELDLLTTEETEPTRNRSKLMCAMDAVNDRFGKGAVHVAATGQSGAEREWVMRQARRTPQYTTCLDDVPVARA